MITPELTEAVAREACRQMGLDADERVSCTERQTMTEEERQALDESMVAVQDILLYRPRWELFRAIAMHRAIMLCDKTGEG